ncbi:pyrroloquinoline quinone biosynthesis protein PqqF [Pantoea sp. 1.19]|uniref:pyrroloquinoline quinone biosynthesis protein PqqF n=1 Tax=Pantoea sp. 1.19 TaxID=1925589 RepID=UPI0009490C37|nr:pyrroloquinoline quinone biosynthesis protein PqqF [Pantoea sp. 1.19]
MPQVTYRHTNGVRVTLVQQPQASRASALWRVAAGSLHEPTAWPGLAHLLEHLLFRGSRRYSGEQQLMHWAPARGGRVNATTRLSDTAAFVEMPAGLLAPAVARLTDLITAPLLQPEAVAQEAAIIDAEYRLLQRDAPGRIEAALLHALSRGDGPLARFRIGSLAAFGADPVRLRAALVAFHQRHYHAGNLHLWLQGPQPLSTLAALADRAAAAVAPARSRTPIRPRAVPGSGLTLRLPKDAPMLVLSFVLPAAARRALRPLALALADPRPGSLLASLRARGLADGITLQSEPLDDRRHWLRVQFTLAQAGSDLATLEALFFRWCRQLAAGDRTLWQRLAQRSAAQLAALTPLEALRAAALGWPAPRYAAWRPLLAALRPARATRLWVSDEAGGEPLICQGLPLRLAPWPVTAHRRTGGGRFLLFPPAARPAEPVLPHARALLAHRPQPGLPQLILRPQCAAGLSDEQGLIWQRRLAPLAADLAIGGDLLSLTAEQGVWTLRITAPAARLPAALAAAITLLRAEDPPADGEALRQARRALRQADRTIAVRRLLIRLPQAMRAAWPRPQLAWQATLGGGDTPLRTRLTQYLSAFPRPLVAAAAPPPPPAGRRFQLTAQDDQHALLLFIPLPADRAACLRAGVSDLQPHFYQQLRIVRQLGYVAQCQWHACADAEGALLLLQSPHTEPAGLRRAVADFLRAEADRSPTAQALLSRLAVAWCGEIVGRDGG